jgi:hypothetical protein
MAPAMAKSATRIFETLMPLRNAACGLPPMAKTERPKAVFRLMNVKRRTGPA